MLMECEYHGMAWHSGGGVVLTVCVCVNVHGHGHTTLRKPRGLNAG